MKADLHIHSTVSDGSDSISKIIAVASQKGLDTIAITDHDTLRHAEQLPADLPLNVIIGTELSAVHRPTGVRAHILGYHIQKPELLSPLTEPLLAARHANSLKQVEILQKEGYCIDAQQLAKADGKYIYKQHIMDWFVRTGQAEEMFGNFYYRIFKNGGICAFDIRYLDVFEAVRAIRSAGGFAVLAHPGQQQNFDLVPQLKKEGLAGIELNHHTHTEKDRDIIRRLAAEYRLFMTGGSDYHGSYEPQIFGIGDFLADESGVKTLC